MLAALKCCVILLGLTPYFVSKNMTHKVKERGNCVRNIFVDEGHIIRPVWQWWGSWGCGFRRVWMSQSNNQSGASWNIITMGIEGRLWLQMFRSQKVQKSLPTQCKFNFFHENCLVCSYFWRKLQIFQIFLCWSSLLCNYIWMILIYSNISLSTYRYKST